MKRFLALTALLFALGLLASRTGLVLHEIGGHWGMAAAFGCRLREIHLFLFAGGWVDFACGPLSTAQSLAIDLGGIALQCAIAVPLLMLARRWPRSLAGLACSVIGALFIVHGLFYLVTGIHYGVGDGRDLHRLLAAQRAVLVAVGSVVLVVSCLLGSRSLAQRLAPRTPVGAWATRVAFLATAMLLATAIHGALMWTELRLREDRVYTATFQPEHEKRIEREVRRFEKEKQRTPEQIAAARQKIVSRHRVFPLRAALGISMGVAALAGVAVALRPRSSGGDAV